MSNALESIRSWLMALRGDIEIVKSVVEAEDARPEARKLAAAALNYLVARLDLIPDWNETIGIMDDAMVLRVCLDLAAEYPLGDSYDEATRGRLDALLGDAEIVRAFIGEGLFLRLRTHCARLVGAEVHGRSPAGVVEDDKIRATLYAELESDLARLPAVSFADPADIELRFKSYLYYKLHTRAPTA